MTITTPHYDVFLSHNGADQADVTILADALRTQGHLQPFLDRWHLIPGMPWQEAIEEALAQSETVAVFFGPSGVSPWHNEQMRVALDEAVRTRDEVRLIPVLLPGATEAALSRFLARRTWVDFRRGLDDAEALQRLVAGIKGEAVADGAYTLPAEPAPYRGLLRFETEHTRFFFGRHLDQQRLLQKLSQQNFLAVVGASGSGKSSLLRAGLLSALAVDALPDSRTWRILSLTPGSQPLRALAQQVATLPATGDRLPLVDALTERFITHSDGLRTAITAYLAEQPQTVLLVVDQFEELFTQSAEGPERCRTQTEQLIANLADAVQHAAGYIRVLITLRADFLDRCLAFPRLRDLLQDRQYLIGALDEPALREAIVRPAQAVGALFEKGLVNTILRDVSAAPAALPLLQHALYELWRARRGPWLTIDAYEASGGVPGALQRRAQSTYESLSPPQQVIAHNIFLRLTALGEGVSDTRRRVDRSELYAVESDPAQVDAVLSALSGPAARLIVSDEGSVEVAHETLIQQWKTLRAWLEADREALRIHRHLTESSQEWQELGRDPGALYRGLLLPPAAAWAAAHVDQLNPLERTFLDASLTLQAQERAEREAQHQREVVAAQRLAHEAEARAQEQTAAASRLRRRALLLAGVGLLAVLLAIATGVFGWRANAASTQAVQQRDLAERRQRQAEAGELAALSADFRASDLPLSLLLASAAINTTYRVDGDYTNKAQAALYNALTVAQPHLRKTMTDSQQIWSAAFSPDGSRFITTACDELKEETLCFASKVRLWDADGSLIKQFAEQTATIIHVRYSPDGARIVTADRKGGARLWDANGQPLARLAGHTESIEVVTFNATGTRLLTAATDGTVRLWDADGKLLAVLASHNGWVKSAVFNSAGTRILTTGCDQRKAEKNCGASSARLWDAAGQPIITFADDSGYVNSAAFNATGSLIITAECAALDGAGSCTQGSARIWDATGKPVATLAGYTFSNAVWSASFNQAGTRILVSSETAAALWSGNRNFLTTLTVSAMEEPRFAEAHFNGAGTAIVTTHRPSSANPGSAPVRLWDTDGKFMVELLGEAGIVTVALFNSADTRLLTADLGGTLQLWDLRDAAGGLITKFEGHTGAVGYLAFNPAGTRLLTAADDGARLWDANGHLLAKLGGDGGGIVYGARFNQTGTRIATIGCCEAASLHLWDANGSAIGAVEAFRLGSGFDFNPSGGGMIVGSEGNTARLLDANNKTLAVLASHSGPINTTFFSPDGRRMVTASADGSARLWDATGNLITTLSGHSGSVYARFSPDGARIITYGDDHTVRLWDAAGHLQTVLTGHTAAVNYGSINRAGTRILSQSADGTTRLWTMAGKLITLLGSHTQKVEMATFNPAGTQVLTVDCDKLNEYDLCIGRAVRLWDSEGKLIAIVDTDWVTRASFSPDGTQIATVGCDELDPIFHITCLSGGAWLWKSYPTIEIMLAEADRRAGRVLTANECQQFLRLEQCV